MAAKTPALETRSLKSLIGEIKLHFDKELLDFVEDVQIQSNDIYYRRDPQSKSKLTNSARTEANPNLKWYTVQYECVHGKRRRSNSQGVRQSS